MQLREIWWAEVAAHDAPALVHEEARRRQPHIAPRPRHGAAGVKRHEEWQLAAFGEIDDVFRPVVAHRHRQRLEAARLKLAVGGRQLRHFRHAGGAACRPEIEQQHLAQKIARLARAAVQQHKLAGGRGLLAAAGEQRASARGQQRAAREGGGRNDVFRHGAAL